MKNYMMNCVLAASANQHENEQSYYRDIVGIDGEFLFAENLEEARLLVIGGKPIRRNYCAFWKTDNSGYYVEEFAAILKEKFQVEDGA